MAMRIGRSLIFVGTRRRPRDSLSAATHGFVVQFGEAACGADGVDMALGQDGAQPRLQRAASMKISKQRVVATFLFGESIEIRKKGVRKIVRGGRTRWTTQDGSRGGAQIRAIRGDEVVPGVGVPIGAGGGQAQVPQMQ